MFEHFTNRARKVMALANQEAQRRNHEFVGTEHILLGLIMEGIGVGAAVLKELNVDLSKIRAAVERLAPGGPEVIVLGQLPLTPGARKVIDDAIEESRNLKHNHVGTEHLLLGLLRETHGIAAQVLAQLGVNPEQAREKIFLLEGAHPEGLEEKTVAEPSLYQLIGPFIHFPQVRRLVDLLETYRKEKQTALHRSDFDEAAEISEQEIEVYRQLKALFEQFKQNSA